MSRPFETITIEQVARYPRPGTTVPGRLGFTPGNTAVTYLFSQEGSLVRSLWRYDLRSGERTVLAGPEAGAAGGELSREEELRRERLRLRELGVTDYHFALKAAEETLLVPGSAGLSVSRGGGPLVEVAGCEGALDPRLSPDGSRVAFVRDGDLYVADISTDEVRRLTFDAEPGLTNGLAEFIAQEELDRERGYWWSEDGTRIAFIQADERHIPEYPIVHQGKPGVDVERHRYPFAGEANARLRLGVIDVEDGSIAWQELAGEDEDFYIGNVYWRPDGGLLADVLSRDQRTLRLVDLRDGRAHTLVKEQQEPWVNLGHDSRFLQSGEFLRTSERTGYRHLFLHAADGAILRQLTAGEWMVTRVAGLDEDHRVAYVLGTRDGTLERHLYAVPLDGGEPDRITEGPGWHDCVFSRDGAWLVDVWSSRAQAPVVTIARSDGSDRRVLFTNEGDSAEALGLAPPDLMSVTAADGITALDAALYRPPGMEPGRRYPLVVSVYGGPHAQSVLNGWSMTVDLRAQYLARRGYLVLKVDNRGSAGRGLAFEAPLALRMGTVELDDQVAAVRQLVEAGLADPGRVGIYGWSYGGYMTCMAMFRAPEVFRVGVAGAPVADWDGYDTGYTERYMSTPALNREGYREGSLLTHVAGLAGKLMLVHGMVDENVHFRHTARLIVALAEAQKSYDLLIFPEERHMPRDARGLEYQERRVLGYFVEYL